jgi:multicomponent Na+:H+ antiporter subunit B
VSAVVDPLVAALLALCVLLAVAIALLADAVAAVVAFGAYGLSLAMLWAVLRAPDVALTEAGVGAAISTALFLAVLRRFPEAFSPPKIRFRVRPATALTAGGAALALGVTVPSLPAFGDPAAPAFRRVVPFYLADAPALGIDNVVTAILVVYRGFDTFGEVVVVFTAGVAAAAVLREVSA